MRFEWPWLLASLALVPALVALYVRWQRRRVRYAVRFTNLDLLAGVVREMPRWRRHVPAALYLLALATLLVSVARPQAVVTVPREQATIVLVMDVSGSMAATDVQPTRMFSAQQAAVRFIDKAPSHFEIGLVSFSTSAHVIAPPTTDRNQVRVGLQTLQARGGTAMGEAINAAVASIQASQANGTASPDGPPAVLLLLSDGASTIGASPVEAARQAAGVDVTIFTVALGTPDGVVEIADGTGGSRRIPVPPDPVTLRQVADVTGGRFYDAPTDSDLAAVYDQLGTRIGFERGEQEVTALFSAVAVGLLVVGGVLSLRWLNRFP
jgi:Ca-activated chloride channel family protein